MERVRQKRIAFNEEKLQFKCMEARFFGHTWTPQGVRPDNSKVTAIQSVRTLEDMKSLQSFLGLVTYLARYSARVATIAAHRCELTGEGSSVHMGPRA